MRHGWGESRDGRAISPSAVPSVHARWSCGLFAAMWMSCRRADARSNTSRALYRNRPRPLLHGQMTRQRGVRGQARMGFGDDRLVVRRPNLLGMQDTIRKQQQRQRQGQQQQDQDGGARWMGRRTGTAARRPPATLGSWCSSGLHAPPASHMHKRGRGGQGK